MEEFDIDIIHHPKMRHDNVDGLTSAYKKMGDVSKDDDFLYATIMTINVEEKLEDNWKIIQYLDGMMFPIKSIKVVRTQIAHKNQNYLIIGD